MPGPDDIYDSYHYQSGYGHTHTMRNPQTDVSVKGRSGSPSGSRSSRSWSSSSEPLTSPPSGMLTNEVICKYCRQRFAYPIGKDVDYFTKWSDLLGLVTCRACYNYQNGLEEGIIDNPESKPKKKKNLYSRKLRIRRKE